MSETFAVSDLFISYQRVCNCNIVEHVFSVVWPGPEHISTSIKTDVEKCRNFFEASIFIRMPQKNLDGCQKLAKGRSSNDTSQVLLLIS